VQQINTKRLIFN